MDQAAPSPGTVLTVFKWGAAVALHYPVMGRLGLSLGRTVARRVRWGSRSLMKRPHGRHDAVRAFDEPLPDGCLELGFAAAELPVGCLSPGNTAVRTAHGF